MLVNGNPSKCCEFEIKLGTLEMYHETSFNYIQKTILLLFMCVSNETTLVKMKHTDDGK